VKTPGGISIFYDVGQGQGWQRNIVMDESPHLPAEILQWFGDSRGRDNGCCEELFSLGGWRPQIVIISDDYKQYDTQETVDWYRQRAIGNVHANGWREDASSTVRADSRVLWPYGRPGL
jgi:hypothetical protein